jgi:hypothetical protein
MAEKNITKKMVLEAIKMMAAEENNDATITVGEGDAVVDVSMADIIKYADTTIAQIDSKNEKAKIRNAAKRAENDEMLAAVEATLTEDNYLTGPEILEKIADQFEDITQAKVTARLTKLCKNGVAHKVDVKVNDRRLKGYALGAEPVNNNTEE